MFYLGQQGRAPSRLLVSPSVTEKAAQAKPLIALPAPKLPMDTLKHGVSACGSSANTSALSPVVPTAARQPYPPTAKPGERAPLLASKRFIESTGVQSEARKREKLE
jgi:hypothetical protein